MGEDDSLAAEGTYLGAADVEHVGQAGNVSQRDIGALADQTVAQPGTVHEQGHVVGVADGGKRFQLCLGVQGAVLRGVGDVDHAGEDEMVHVGVGVECFAEILHILGGHFAVGVGQAEHFVARELDGTGLMGGYMAGGGSQYALPAVEHGADDHGVGLSAAGDEKDIRLRAGAGRADLLFGAGTIGVGAVTGNFFKVGLYQFLQNGRVGTLTVVVFKV